MNRRLLPLKGLFVSERCDVCFSCGLFLVVDLNALFAVGSQNGFLVPQTGGLAAARFVAQDYILPPVNDQIKLPPQNGFGDGSLENTFFQLSDILYALPMKKCVPSWDAFLCR